MSAFIAGVIAGYGIAIPVGAIAILIVETGLRRGFRAAFAAGAGAATADLAYAFLAVLAGQSLARSLEPYAGGLRLVSAGVLIGLGGWGLWKALQARQDGPDPVQVPRADRGVLRTYLRFSGLTLLNPLTVAYFAALILGGSGGLATWGDRAAFVGGAALASLSWQSLLAGIGAAAHSRLSPRVQMWLSVLGNLIVIALGVRLLIR
jgi:arginine exporter protein ArgO